MKCLQDICVVFRKFYLKLSLILISRGRKLMVILRSIKQKRDNEKTYFLKQKFLKIVSKKSLASYQQN